MAFIMGKKIDDLKNDIFDKISVQMSLYYTQIKGITTFWGVCFLTLG